MPNIKVLGERILVKEMPSDNKIGGIIIPKQGQVDKSQGIVIDIGQGALTEKGTLAPMFVKPFDHVIYADFAGAPIIVGDDKYVVLNQRDVLAIIDPETQLEYPEVFCLDICDENIDYSDILVFSDEKMGIKHMIQICEENNISKEIINEFKKSQHISKGRFEGTILCTSSFVKAKSEQMGTKVNKDLGYSFDVIKPFMYEDLSIRRKVWEKDTFWKFNKKDFKIDVYKDGELQLNEIPNVSDCLKHDWEFLQ
jgi:chaperonin GroES